MLESKGILTLLIPDCSVLRTLIFPLPEAVKTLLPASVYSNSIKVC